MKSSVKVTVNYRQGVFNKHELLPVDIKTFTGGEIDIKMDTSHFRGIIPINFVINAFIKDSDGIMATLLVQDAIKRHFGYDSIIDLSLVYVPYGRQDRVCNKGEAFGLKVFANIINTAKFNNVYVYDPHSHVTEALLDNCSVTNQVSCFLDTVDNASEFFKNHTIISPDAGATKKATEIARILGKDSVVVCEKVRNPMTMEIEKTVVHMDPSKPVPLSVLIVDDICDGGRTFIELAKILKQEKGVSVVDLYVTHGIFSYGKEKVLEHVDNIYCHFDWTK